MLLSNDSELVQVLCSCKFVEVSLFAKSRRHLFQMDGDTVRALACACREEKLSSGVLIKLLH